MKNHTQPVRATYLKCLEAYPEGFASPRAASRLWAEGAPVSGGPASSATSSISPGRVARAFPRAGVDGGAWAIDIFRAYQAGQMSVRLCHAANQSKM